VQAGVFIPGKAATLLSHSRVGQQLVQLFKPWPSCHIPRINVVQHSIRETFYLLCKSPVGVAVDTKGGPCTPDHPRWSPDLPRSQSATDLHAFPASLQGSGTMDNPLPDRLRNDADLASNVTGRPGLEQLNQLLTNLGM
jgi:hypothetical protein